MNPLPAPLRERVASGRFDYHRKDADTHGVPPVQLMRWVRAGHLESLGAGDYVIAAPAQATDVFERARELHLRRCASVIAGSDGMYLVGRSSALAHGVAVLSNPEQVEVSRLPRCITRRTALHPRSPWGSPPILAAGLRCQPIEEAVIDIAAEHGFKAGIVSADAALHAGASATLLRDAGTAFGTRRGGGQARRAADLADARIESPGESLVRCEALEAGIGLIPQAEIRTPAGLFVARVDFLVEGTKVVVEFDGMSKYAGPEDLRREKRRQVALERLGYRVVRFTFEDLRHAGIVGATLRRLAHLAA